MLSVNCASGYSNPLNGVSSNMLNYHPCYINGVVGLLGESLGNIIYLEVTYCQLKISHQKLKILYNHVFFPFLNIFFYNVLMNIKY